MKSPRIKVHQEAFRVGGDMTHKATGESGALSMTFEVAEPDPETARQRGLEFFDWRAESLERSRLNKEQVRRKAPRSRAPAAQKAGPRMQRTGQPVVLPHPNPQPPNIRPAFGAPTVPERHPFDPEPMRPRLLPPPIPQDATRRSNKIAGRTLPAFNPPVAVKEERRVFMPVLERLSSGPDSQFKTRRGNESDALGSTVTSEQKVFREGGRFGKGVWQSTVTSEPKVFQSGGRFGKGVHQ